MKSTNPSTILIVLFTVGLVSAPILRTGLRVEVAKWYLAAAANSIELDKGDGESQIKQAERWNPGITEFQDYWSIRIKQAKKQSPEKLTEMAKQGPASQRRFIGMDVVAELVKMEEYELAGSTADWLRTNDPEIIKNLYFWQLLVQIDYRSPAETTAMLSLAGTTRAIERLQEAIAFSDNARLLALLYSRIFTQEHEFEPALEALKLGLGKDFKRDSENLNQLAYLRSLALVELDEALKDINEAIEKIPPGITQLAEQSALRDTRAWVLYRLGKYQDAFIDADFAVRTSERPTVWQRLVNGLNSLTPTDANAVPKDLAADNKKKSESDSELPLTESSGSQRSEYLQEGEVDRQIWNVGVMRYHRAKILEKLDRSDEAQADWEWIKSHRLPPDDRLH